MHSCWEAALENFDPRFRWIFFLGTWYSLKMSARPSFNPSIVWGSVFGLVVRSSNSRVFRLHILKGRGGGGGGKGNVVQGYYQEG